MIAKNLDLMVETALIHGRLATGTSPAFTAANSSLGNRGVTALAGKSKVKDRRGRKTPKWSQEENDFLKSCLGVLSEEEIADALGRTRTGVRIHWKRELQLTAPSRRPDIITCYQIAAGIGIDAKSAVLLIDRGILPGYCLPFNNTIRIVNRITLLRFLTNPMNWVYFRPERVGKKWGYCSNN